MIDPTPRILPLGNVIGVRRRYARSVNLERDLEIAEALEGYTVTPVARDALTRILSAATARAVPRAWTLTGVYGTGKSAFAHVLAAAFAARGSASQASALRILHAAAESDTALQLAVKAFQRRFGGSGVVRAVATGRMEPLPVTVVRALVTGADAFWAGRTGRKPAVLREIDTLRRLMLAGDSSLLQGRGARVATKRHGLDSVEIAGRLPALTADLAAASRSGLLLVLDELGRNLTFAAQHQRPEDLALLQDLAELSAASDDTPIVVVGLLHQALGEYGQALAATQRIDWEKVQGRFEDVPFVDAGLEVVRLLGEAIVQNLPTDIAASVVRHGAVWHSELAGVPGGEALRSTLRPADLARLYPLHPTTALVLPSLCAKYAQNDRSLFTFLASGEPHALGRFLQETTTPDWRNGAASPLPTLKVAEAYDYFVHAAGAGLSSRPQYQRWAEVQSIITDSQSLPPDELLALKTIGVLNLVGTNGAIRASRRMTVLALTDDPTAAPELARWEELLDRLIARGIVSWRGQTDELRLWEGSDFDVESAVREAVLTERRSPKVLMSAVVPLGHIVAQRHSYRTGTLRYFEARYADEPADLDTLPDLRAESDGLVIYWLADQLPAHVPAVTGDGRPVVVVTGAGVEGLVRAARVAAALLSLDRSSPVIHSDGVARREVRHRTTHAARSTAAAFAACFEGGGMIQCAAGGRPQSVTPRAFNALLSELCDVAYAKSPVLWNELLNRRELTSQGARARRELIAAMLRAGDQEGLGLAGTGPEVSMYASTLRRAGVHARRGDQWSFGRPSRPDPHADVREAWDAIEKFCKTADQASRPLSELYDLLARPPYGMKQGAVPVLLAAVLLAHAEDVSVYKEGTFLPTLSEEHFELMVKAPARFSVKFFALTGVRTTLFRELESILQNGLEVGKRSARNATLLGLVRPLVRMVTRLPQVTRKSERITERAKAVRAALLTAREPDVLLFHDLPVACEVAPFEGAGTRPRGSAHSDVERFRRQLLEALRELQLHYERLLDHCRVLLHQAFGVQSPSAEVRADLRIRAQYLIGRVLDPRLRSLLQAFANPASNDREWLEAVVMIVADKPAESWDDQDVLAFEVNVMEYARRFANLEAMQREALAAPREGYDSLRVTVTHPEGHETHRLVWVDRRQQQQLEQLADRMKLSIGAHSDPAMVQAVVALLVERTFGQGGGTSAPDVTAAIEPAKSPTKRQRGGHGQH